MSTIWQNSGRFSFQRNMIKSWKPMAPHCWAVFMSQVWQSPKMDSWNFSGSVHITRIWIFTMLEECLHYKMNIYVRNRLCFVLCDKKNTDIIATLPIVNFSDTLLPLTIVKDPIFEMMYISPRCRHLCFYLFCCCYIYV